uniref:Uncharacterized protein n=1 Tax=Daphnia galeata TaxID=27404 RepID=A0A8J2RE37_9CRUS|nr:unnamed protein product [Daphnia galeata]
MGGAEFSEKYKERLEQENRGSKFGHYRTQTQSKNIFKAFKNTSYFVCVVAVFFYFVSGFLGLLGLYPLANLGQSHDGLTLVTLCTCGLYQVSAARFSFSIAIFPFSSFLRCYTKLLAMTTLRHPVMFFGSDKSPPFFFFFA